MLQKLTSRKFWLSILVVLCAIALMATGNLDAATGAKIILGAAGAFIGMEGLKDALQK